MPVVVTLPVSVMPVACVLVAARLLSAVLLPSVEPKLTAPLPAVIVSANAPLMVLLKATALLVVASVLPAASVTAPV